VGLQDLKGGALDSSAHRLGAPARSQIPPEIGREEERSSCPSSVSSGIGADGSRGGVERGDAPSASEQEGDRTGQAAEPKRGILGAHRWIALSELLATSYH
jgi:hypothetical protein